MPKGATKGTKAPQKSPAKAQAHMLRTSRRREGVLGEDINRQGGAMEQSMVHEVDSPFSMDQI